MCPCDDGGLNLTSPSSPAATNTDTSSRLERGEFKLRVRGVKVHLGMRKLNAVDENYSKFNVKR